MADKPNHLDELVEADRRIAELTDDLTETRRLLDDAQANAEASLRDSLELRRRLAGVAEKVRAIDAGMSKESNSFHDEVRAALAVAEGKDATA